MVSSPKVSVVTPMFNAERYIEDAVRSVLAQTFADFEYIIVNDGSTDTCGAIADRLAAEDARVRVVHLAANVGNSRANNHGFALAKGEYIACMDADDICHPQRLEKQVAFMDATPEVGLCATQYWRLAVDGKVLRKTRSKLGDAVLKFYLLFGVPVCNPTTFFRREVLEAFLPEVYTPALKAAADYDFLCRVAARWRMHVLPDYLFYYRINPNGLSKLKKQVLIEETVARAVPEMRTLLNARGMGATVSDAELAGFIETHGNTAVGMDRARLRIYGRVLRALCAAYGNELSSGERRQVGMFCLELEAKTLLWRYRMVKKPGLLVRWLPGFMAQAAKVMLLRG